MVKDLNGFLLADWCTCTLLLLIFAGLNFRDFRDFQKIAKLKTREN